MTCGACKEFRTRRFRDLRKHWRTDCGWRQTWARVVEARARGAGETADRIARRALGIKGEEMSEETKEKLRRYREEHTEELKLRAKLKRQAKARLRAFARPSRRR